MKYFFFLLCLLMYSSCSAKTFSGNEAISGTWLIELTSNDISFARTVFSFEADSTNFYAYTRKNADRAVLGTWTSTMGRIFTKNFKDGSLLRIDHGKIKTSGDTTILNGIFYSAIGTYYFDGKLINNQLEATLKDGRYALKGTIQGRKEDVKLPLENYSALVDESISTTKEKIFNRAVLDGKEWKSFEKNMRGVAGEAQDDIEFIFAHFYYGSKLPFSHYAMFKTAPDAEMGTDTTVIKNISLEELNSKTILMKISSFSGSADEVDEAFAEVFKKGYQNLVVDLRNNTGGSVEAGMRFAQYLTDTPFYGGVFLTQKWFNENSNIPRVEDYGQLPLFTAANYDLIIKGINEQKGLCLKVVPLENTFKGNIFILTNSSTASTCEPIVYGMKQYKRAKIVGEKTAGAMLNGESFPLKNGFNVVIPTAKYFTADGFKIDQAGVEPDYKVEQEKALEFVLNNLLK